MRWYNLQELLPPVYAGVTSMYETAVTENTELLGLYAIRDLILKNFFIQTCDVKTLQYWEQLLDIELFGDETLDDRRQMIMLYLVSNWQITKPYVEKVGRDYFGEGNFTIDYDENNHLIVYVRMYNSEYNPIHRFVKWFEKVCPAHIKWWATPAYCSESQVDCSSESISATFCTCKATSSVGTQTIYLGETPYVMDWVEV